MVERRIEATTQINASAARVWAILTDFARMPCWNPFIVFAVSAGVVILHETLSWTLVAGAIVCIVGVALTQIGSVGQHGLLTVPRVPVWPTPGECP